MTDAPLDSRPTPMQSGDRYLIRKSIIEGTATLVRPDPHDDDGESWFVRFVADEPGAPLVSRRVWPKDRVNP